MVGTVCTHLNGWPLKYFEEIKFDSIAIKLLVFLHGLISFVFRDYYTLQCVLLVNNDQPR